MTYLSLLVILSYENQDKEFLLKLKDGSAIYAKFESKKLAVKTDFGYLEISTSEIKSLKRSKEGVVIKTLKSEIVGNIEGDIAIKTNYGDFNVKPCDIEELIPTMRGFCDKNIVGFWDFNGEEDVKLQGGKYVFENGRTAVELDLSKDEYIEIPHKDEQSHKEVITIEIRFKFKDISTHATRQIELLMKGKAYGTDENYRVMIFPQIKQFQLGSSTEKKKYPYACHTIDEFSTAKWHYLAVSFDAKNKKIDVYFDGIKLPNDYSIRFDGSPMNTTKSPIYICKRKFDNNNTIWIDNIRISNKTRTEDEIKESAKKPAFDVKPPLILTKTGECFACKLLADEIIVSTEYGKMKIPTKDINNITFGSEDSVNTSKSIIKGKVELDKIELKTCFGDIKLEKKQIHSIKLAVSGDEKIAKNQLETLAKFISAVKGKDKKAYDLVTIDFLKRLEQDPSGSGDGSFMSGYNIPDKIEDVKKETKGDRVFLTYEFIKSNKRIKQTVEMILVDKEWKINDLTTLILLKD